ncbi:ogr/Delta-like zinc finger family protein [Halomonas mongoliensis]|uniref:ogr/Delta-like zinc finger family protein n=2 Tax=Halomonas mongoliensis TaxID=321265 RepID=UPI00403ACD98
MSDQTRAGRHARHRNAMTCPHCKGPARVRDSRRVSELCREGIVECQVAECGWRGTFSTGYVHTLTPSARPDPAVNLPLSPSAREALAEALSPPAPGPRVKARQGASG